MKYTQNIIETNDHGDSELFKYIFLTVIHLPDKTDD